MEKWQLNYKVIPGLQPEVKVPSTWVFSWTLYHRVDTLDSQPQDKLSKTRSGQECWEVWKGRACDWNESSQEKPASCSDKAQIAWAAPACIVRPQSLQGPGSEGSSPRQKIQGKSPAQSMVTLRVTDRQCPLGQQRGAFYQLCIPDFKSFHSLFP